MAGRSPVRFIAPLALVAFAVALFIVVSSTTRNDGETPAARDASPAAQTPEKPESGSGKQRRQPKRYTVKTGDTPSGIAEKTNVPLTELLELNPDLDPQSLVPGMKLKLR